MVFFWGGGGKSAFHRKIQTSKFSPTMLDNSSALQPFQICKFQKFLQPWWIIIMHLLSFQTCKFQYFLQSWWMIIVQYSPFKHVKFKIFFNHGGVHSGLNWENCCDRYVVVTIEIRLFSSLNGTHSRNI